MPSPVLSDDAAQSLFLAWVKRLAYDRLGVGHAGGSGPGADGIVGHVFGANDTNGFVLELAPSNAEMTLKDLRGVSEPDVRAILDEATNRTDEADFGDGVVYRFAMQTGEIQLGRSLGVLHFLRQINDQVRIQGPRRLSDVVLLDFVETPPADPTARLLFAPKTDIEAILFAPGPSRGEFSDHSASGMAETVAAIWALALGRPVDLPPLIMPAPPEVVTSAQARRRDLSILTLARDGVSLDLFGALVSLGDFDAPLRARGSLLSYHAALQTRNPDVATMLFVTSLEALIVPRPEWRRNQVTKRFIDALIDLCPDTISSMLAHPNVEQAFAFRKRGGVPAQQKALLNRIYELRSDPTHSGLGLSGVGLVAAMGDASTMRVALLSRLCKGAILAFLQAPRSSLIGQWQADCVTRQPSR